MTVFGWSLDTLTVISVGLIVVGLLVVGLVVALVGRESSEGRRR